MTEPVVVPGPRDVRAGLDTGTADHCVVACPPHPQLGGTRDDRRLRAVADTLGDRDIGCLRFDYGPWDDGYGELEDAINAIGWARDRFDRVGCFGYSFGGSIALLAAADTEVACVSALAPGGRLNDDLDPATRLASISAPVQVIYGERDSTADWEPVVTRARELGVGVEAMGADHHFVGQGEKIGRLVAEFADTNLRNA